MRLCCTTSASSAGKSNDKRFGGKLGVFRSADGSPANLSTSSLLESWNNEYMRSVRRTMLKGEIPVSCTKCFKEEANGVNSKRIWETEYWAKRTNIQALLDNTKPDGTIPKKIIYLDLRFGHHCNLKCSMCSPHDSSAWISDWQALYPQIQNKELKDIMTWKDRGQYEGASYRWHENNPRYWEELYSQIPHIQQIYFAGGEPLLIDEHYELLEECIKQGRASEITLRYNSNGTVLPDRLIPLWEQFKYVRFGFSLDCFGEKNTYIRYPAKWEKIERNLHLLDNTSDKIEVTLACAVQALNMYYVPDFIEWKLKQNFKKISSWPNGAGLINFHFVYHPANLNVKILPPDLKAAIGEKFEPYCGVLEQRFKGNEDFLTHSYGVRRLRSMVKFMNSEDWSNRIDQFQEYIQLTDKIRKTSFEKTFPEIFPYMMRNAKTPNSIPVVKGAAQPSDIHVN